MAHNQWPRKPKASFGSRNLAAPRSDDGRRWTIIWDTRRQPGTDGRSTAAEQLESAALDRARHMLRMGFVVYEIREPTGAMFLDELGIKERLGLQAAMS